MSWQCSLRIVNVLVLHEIQWIVTSGSQVVVLAISFTQLISQLLMLGCVLLFLLHSWILINVDQISHNSTSIYLLLLSSLQLFPTGIHFITRGHIIIKVLIYHLIFVWNLLSLVAFASILSIQTFLNHSDATSVVGLVDLRAISVISIT